MPFPPFDRKVKIFFLLLIWPFTLASGQKLLKPIRKISLDNGWKIIKNTDAGMQDTIPATVPGMADQDAVRNENIFKVIENKSLIKEKSLSAEGFISKPYSYFKNIDICDSIWNYKNIDLVFDGIDTYSEISINGHEVLKTDNMFRSWRIPAKDWLHRGSNLISIKILDPVKEGAKSAYSFHLPASDPVAPMISPYIRKSPYMFGWDFAPRLLTSGIWKSVRIECNDGIRMLHVSAATQNIVNDTALLNLKIQIHSDFRLNKVKLYCGQFVFKMDIIPGDTIVSLDFKIPNPRLWWPNQSGAQELYHFPLKLMQKNKLLDSKTLTTGLRTIELINESDSTGNSFFFRVNGKPVFMKGANYVPVSSIPSQKDHDTKSRLLHDAASCGMNMIRIWGGGMYEDDSFYDLCDSLGLLVWHDFMFAGAMYPFDSTFMQNVKEEATFQIKRLQNHPCMALWCGNNEIDVAWKNWGWQQQYHISPADSAAMHSGYEKLFMQMLPEKVQEISPGIPYIHSSPLSNWGRRKNFSNLNMHYWGVWHGEEPIDSFRVNVPRFMTEYGMQSYPRFSLLKSANGGIDPDSTFMNERQLSYKGNRLLQRYVEDFFGTSESTESFCYKSQLNQAEAMRIAINSHRKAAGLCMGTLFWQLNDTWPGASWSTIESDGNWKAAQYAVKELYQQNLIIPEIVNDSLEVWFQTFSGKPGKVNLLCEAFDFTGRVSATWTAYLEIKDFHAACAGKWSLAKTMLLSDRRSGFILISAIQGSDTVSKSVCYMVKPSGLILKKPNLIIRETKSDNSAKIVLQSDVLVKGLMLEYPGTAGHFSDNYFDLLPGQPVTILFQSQNKIGSSLKFKYLNPDF